MGADMLIATVRDNYGRSLEDLEAIIDALTPARAANIFYAVEGEHFDGLYGDEYGEDDDTELSYVQGKLRFAVNAIRGHARDVAYVEYAGDGYQVILWITGGMSWGDEPTEVFSPFLYLAEAAIL